MTGAPQTPLEFARGVLAAQGFSRLLGTRLAALEPDRAELELDIRDEHLQQQGSVHGGVLAYLVDNAMAFAAGNAVRAPVVTSELKVNLLRPVRQGRLRAIASIERRGASQVVCLCRVEAEGTEGPVLVAIGLGTVTVLAAS